MALWLVRGGRNGEHEQRFLGDNRIYATPKEFKVDFATLATKDKFRAALEKTYPEFPKGKISNYLGQLWQFAQEMRVGDLVAMPLKRKAEIAFGEIRSDYEFREAGMVPYWHSRKVKWLNEGVPRSLFDQDLLYSFGAFMTICKVDRNDAEARVRKLATGGWKTAKDASVAEQLPPTEPDGIDLERLAMDQIAKLVIARFKGHGMERLVDAILTAQGYVTHRPPEGPDKGVDILAAAGPQGFTSPRICVQVKSGDGAADHPTLQQLIGTMQVVGAEFGLLVSWGGFKSSVDKVQAQHFFKVRLWDQDTLIGELLKVYDKLDEDIRTELPLKRIWTVAAQEEGE